MSRVMSIKLTNTAVKANLWRGRMRGKMRTLQKKCASSQVISSRIEC